MKQKAAIPEAIISVADQKLQEFRAFRREVDEEVTFIVGRVDALNEKITAQAKTNENPEGLLQQNL